MKSFETDNYRLAMDMAKMPRLYEKKLDAFHNEHWELVAFPAELHPAMRELFAAIERLQAGSQPTEGKQMPISSEGRKR